MEPVSLCIQLGQLLLADDIQSKTSVLSAIKRKWVSVTNDDGTAKSRKVYLENILKKNPRNLEALIILAQILRQEGEQEGDMDSCEKAKELAKRALRVDPETGFVYKECMVSLCSLIPRGGFYYEIKPQLLADMEEALQLAPNNVDVITLLGVEYRDQDPGRSHQLLARAVALDGNNIFALNSLAELLYTGGNRDPAQARVLLEKAHSIDPEHPLTCLLLGEVLHHFKDSQSSTLISYALQDRPKLKQHLKAALSGNHSHIIALMYLSRILQQGIDGVHKDEAEAIKLRRMAKHRDPNDVLNLLRIFSDFDIDARVAQADRVAEYQRNYIHEPGI